MIKTFEINNQIGDTVILMDLGARLISWQTEVANEIRDIVVHYPNVQDYYDDSNRLGAIVGPYANVIANAATEINQSKVKLNANAATHHLHGGKNALDACVWQVKQHSERAITFTYWLENGFNGYPGAMTFEVEYRLAEKTSQLKVNFNIVAEQTTIIGPSSCAYFNLSGTASNIDQHKLEIYSDKYIELTDDELPTGSLNKITASNYDFGLASALAGKKIHQSFVTNSDNESHALLVSPCGKLSMLIKSDHPCSHVCTGDHFVGDLASRQGISIAPQCYPDAPNQSNFPFEFTAPDKPFSRKILYKLEK